MATPSIVDPKPLLQNEKKSLDRTLPPSVIYDAEAAEVLQHQWRRQARRRRRVFHFLVLFSLLGFWAVGRQYFFQGRPSHNALSKCGGEQHALEHPGHPGYPDHPHPDHPHPDHPDHPDHRIPPGVPPGIILGECTSWGSPPDSDRFEDNNGHDHGHPLSAFADFPLSVTHESDLFLVSRGSFSFGSLQIVQSEDLISTDAKVTVEIKYHDERYLDLAKVCKVSRVYQDGKEAFGVGIFTPDWSRRHPPQGPRHHEHPWFNVTLELPKATSEDSKDALLKISGLTTDLPIFRHSLKALETVSFGSLNLATANAEIISENVWADNIIVHTANQAIRGTFRARSSISLKTANGPIDVTLELQNPDSNIASSASLITANSPIKANAILSTAESNSGAGSFVVNATTANGRVGLAFLEAPVNSLLTARASGVFGPVDVTLHPTYQGAFSLKTVFASARIHESEAGKEDPEGKGHTRVVDVTKVTPAELSGAVYWDEEKKAAGSVVLDSQFAPVALFV